MKTSSKILGAMFVAAFAFNAFASPSVAPGDNTQQLPIKGVLAAVKNGKVAFVSDNGRFVFQGKMYDTWNQKDITNLEEAKFANDYLELDKLKFKVDELTPLVIGAGKKEVVIFYDPYCPSCKDLMVDALQEEGYVFKFVAIPVMGEDSIKAVRFALCSTDKELAEKVLRGQVKGTDIPNDKFEMCDTGPIAKRVISTQLFGLRGVPFMVRDDGLVRSGYVKGGLTSWLAGGQ